MERIGFPVMRTFLTCRHCSLSIRIRSKSNYTHLGCGTHMTGKMYKTKYVDYKVNGISAVYSMHYHEKINTGLTFTQQRHFSKESIAYWFSPQFPPIAYAQDIFMYAHDSLCLPWWASIPVTAFGVRTVTTLPLSIYSSYVLAKVQCLEPELKKLAGELKVEVAVAVKKFGWTEKFARYQFNSNMKRLQRQLFIRDNCHPLKASIIAWIQIPMWVSLSVAMRNMAGALQLGPQEGQPLCPGLGSEGMLWFTNMLVPDSTFVLPILMGVCNLAIIEMNLLKPNHQPGKVQKVFTNMLRGLSVFMIPIAASVPSCMCYYWTCSSIYGLAQNILLKFPSIRRACGIPQTAGESDTPFQDIWTVGKQKYFFTSKQKDDAS